MNNQARFRELFLELENLTLNKNGSSFDNESFYAKSVELRDKRIYPYYSEFTFIDYCRNKRNDLSHQILDNKYADFTDELIEKLERIVDFVKYPKKALEKANKNIFSVTVNDSILETLKIMNEKNYSFIPVYDEGLLCGVLTSEVIRNLVEHRVNLYDEIKFSDVKEYISIESSKEKLLFVNKDTKLQSVIDQFFTNFGNNEKTHCVFVTENGRYNEKVLGLFTAWDILKILNDYYKDDLG